MRHDAFAHRALAEVLLQHALQNGDGAHDEGHLLRVWRNVEQIAAREGGDVEILQAATILHDCVQIDKGSPDRDQASRLSARKAAQVLKTLGWPEGQIAEVRHAVEAHSFSAGIESVSIEAKILQDADRLDSLGLIGVARCFYVAGMGGSRLYNVHDPKAETRHLDDRAFALDHFQTKLLKLGERFKTATGRQMATERLARLRGFYEGFLAEIGTETS